jgi:hypothetical protein
MKVKNLAKFFSDGGIAERVTLKYYSADVEAAWTIDVEGPDSLQVVYERKGEGQIYSPSLGKAIDMPDQSFWLYLHPSDAAVIGKILTAYAIANGEKA